MKKKFSEIFTSKFILILVTGLCVIFIAISFFTNKLVTPLKNVVSAVVVPLQKGMNYMGLWATDGYDRLQEVNRLLDENEKLNEQVDNLTEENNRLKQDTYELDRLRELYELDAKYTEYPKTGARIIGTSSDNWFSTFTIDKGSDDGLETDMNVIAGGGLVGIITEVGKNYHAISASLWLRRRRTSSPPAYPVAPIIPAFIISTFSFQPNISFLSGSFFFPFLSDVRCRPSDAVSGRFIKIRCANEIFLIIYPFSL